MAIAKTSRKRLDIKVSEIFIDGVSLGVMQFPAGSKPDPTVRQKLRKIFGKEFDEKHTMQVGPPGGTRSKRAAEKRN